MANFIAKTGKILAVCLSKEKGTVKKEVASAVLVEDHGLQEDAHAGKWHRQVSLLGVESINKMRDKGFQINFGDFAENIATEGIILNQLPIGTKLEVGENVLLEITQIGKKCHHDCEIKQKIGDCVMPKEGIFAKVLKGGEIKAGDSMKVLSVSDSQ
ncbi:MAG: MOSC domain-containing protein [Atribacterota bacterium]|nr:MOSC domain-containing protein [Atribacterota bacterium]